MSNKNKINNEPSRKLVDIAFWVGHLGIIIYFVLFSQIPKGQNPSGYIFLPFLIGLLSIIVYFVAIGVYAKKTGRSPIIWGLGSMLFSPISIWVSYFASFTLRTKKSP